MKGKISEAEFILFKLQQLGSLDPCLLVKLSHKFDELDTDGSGFLEVGGEVEEGDTRASGDSDEALREAHIAALRRGRSMAMGV